MSSVAVDVPKMPSSRVGGLDDPALKHTGISNRIFGFQTVESDATVSPDIQFKGAVRIHPRGDQASQAYLFATPGTPLANHYSTEYESNTFVWGVPAHPDVSRADIPAWCADVVGRKAYERFGDLLGTFVVIVDEPRKHRLTLVSDALGIRPLFVGKHRGRLVFGSDVWAMQEAGLTTGDIDYAALSCWIAYGIAGTGGSLFADLHRLAPGAALVIEKSNATEIPYTTVHPTDRIPTTAQAAAEMHEIVSTTAAALLKGQSSLSLPLSGGFDSRYLMALSLELKAPVDRIVTVNFTDEETEVSRRTAEILRVPLENFPVRGSVWDLYDQVHHFMADGLPISKFVTYKVAERYAGLPMINGFLGGIIIRGFDDVFGGKHEHEWTEEPVTVMQRNFLLSDLDLFRPDIAGRIRTRSRAPLELLAEKGGPAGKIMDWTNMYHRQRYMASNNYLQHLHLTEAVLPFYSWRLVKYKMEHPYEVFNDAVYDTIFRTYYPSLAGVPHSLDVLRAKLRQSGKEHSRWRVANCTASWARQLLPWLLHSDLLAKEKCLPLLVLGMSTAPSRLSHRVAVTVEGALLTFRRLYLLEKRVKEAGLVLDWGRL